MNWIGLIAALALTTIVFGIVSDFQMTPCRAGSLYAVVRACTPNQRAPATKSFDCRFQGDKCG